MIDLLHTMVLLYLDDRFTAYNGFVVLRW